MERDSNEISTATPTFSARSDSLKLVPTFSDVGRQPDIAMAAYKPEEVITQERIEIATKFQTLSHIFGHARLIRTGPDIVRCRPTTENSNGGQKPVCSPPLLFLAVGRMSVDIGQCWR